MQFMPKWRWLAVAAEAPVFLLYVLRTIPGVPDEICRMGEHAESLRSLKFHAIHQPRRQGVPAGDLMRWEMILMGYALLLHPSTENFIHI
jgi:hypothetical protein